jgi:hypothetical protein
MLLPMQNRAKYIYGIAVIGMLMVIGLVDGGPMVRIGDTCYQRVSRQLHHNVVFATVNLVQRVEHEVFGIRVRYCRGPKPVVWIDAEGQRLEREATRQSEEMRTGVQKQMDWEALRRAGMEESLPSR